MSLLCYMSIATFFPPLIMTMILPTYLRFYNFVCVSSVSACNTHPICHYLCVSRLVHSRWYPGSYRRRVLQVESIQPKDRHGCLADLPD